MKQKNIAKVICSAVCILGSLSTSYAYTNHNISAANFLAGKGIINDNSSNILGYNLDNKITRREMLKVMMNLSGKSVASTCSGKFSDLPSSDWGCKYAETALKNGFISANATFRPTDNVTQIEALKMIMQAKWIQKDSNSDWKAGYVSAAYKKWLLDSNYLSYDTQALRGWIFSTSAKSYSDFSYTESAGDESLDPEIEELFNSILWL